MIPGEIEVDGSPPPAATAPAVTIEVRNEGDRPVQVGSHFHLFEANPALRLDRAAAYGMRLAIPAGTSVRFEPGESRVVEAVPLGGARRVRGFHGLVDGELDAAGARDAALGRARDRGFGELA